MRVGVEARHAIGALGHDVGKYIARVARNVTALEGVLPPALHVMLLVDLYGDEEKPRASRSFDELAQDLGPDLELSPTPLEVRRRLEAIDALEAAVRSADPEAVAEASRLALMVADAIRAWMRSSSSEGQDER